MRPFLYYARNKARASAERNYVIMESRPARAGCHDKWLSCEHRDAELRTGTERVIRGQRCNESFVEHRLHVERRLIDRPPRKTDIKPVRAERLDLHRGGHLVKSNLDPWTSLTERAHDLREAAIGD